MDPNWTWKLFQLDVNTSGVASILCPAQCKAIVVYSPVELSDFVRMGKLVWKCGEVSIQFQNSMVTITSPGETTALGDV